MYQKDLLIFFLKSEITCWRAAPFWSSKIFAFSHYDFIVSGILKSFIPSPLPTDRQILRNGRQRAAWLLRSCLQLEHGQNDVGEPIALRKYDVVPRGDLDEGEAILEVQALGHKNMVGALT